MQQPAIIQRSELRSLHQIAREALAQYPLRNARIRLLGYRSNLLYGVEARDARGKPRRLSLRLFQPGYASAQTIKIQQEWVSLLASEGLHVPRPVLTRRGDGVCAVDGRFAVLQEWLPGRRLLRHLTPEHLHLVSQFMGKMHRLAETRGLRNQRQLKRWDWSRVFGDDFEKDANVLKSYLSPRDLRTLRGYSALLQKTEAQLGRGARNYGIIHSDLHPANVVFDGPRVGVLDWEDCGLGYYLFDLAVLFIELEEMFPANHVPLRDAAIEGYSSERRLPDLHLIERFIAMRYVDIAWWLARGQDARSQQVTRDWISAGIFRMRARLDIA